MNSQKRKKGVKLVMELNLPKLKGYMAEKDVNMTQLAVKSGINVSTLSRKLSNGGLGLKVGEMHAIVRALGLTGKEAQSVFLFQNSHKCE